MKIGIIDADLLDNGTKHPNLALMKISKFHKDKKDEVTLLVDYNNIDNYDKVYISKVFTFTNIPSYIINKANVEIGGTGFFGIEAKPLPNEIEHYMPDYDLYKEYINNKINSGVNESYFDDYLNYSIGFTTRGCFRKCEFCVNRKYDKSIKHSPINEFLNPEKPKIHLWDDNFLACDKWSDILDELIETNKPFQFRQGLDIRLLTDEKAKRLSRVKYSGDFIFAFDHIKDTELIESKLKLWRKYTKKSTKLYLLCGYDSIGLDDIVNIFKRIEILLKYDCVPYIMRYENYINSEFKDMYIQIARWCNQPRLFKKLTFKKFCFLCQKEHRGKGYCKAVSVMKDFEKQYPDIAKKYFNIKFTESKRKGW